jgi:hypothetical protein
MPVGRVTDTLNDSTYKEKAGMSFDGLLVPFTSNPNSTSTTLPKFVEPAEDAEDPTVDELNPFGASGIAAVFPDDGETVPDDIADSSKNAKGLALKGPLIIAGFGRDTDGNPVPSGDGPEGYLDNYRNRADQWKVGPLDTRWDEARGVWNAAGSSAGARLGILSEALVGGGSGLATMIDPLTKSATSTTFYVYDYLLGSSATLPWSTRFIANLIGGRWYLVAVQSPC